MTLEEAQEKARPYLEYDTVIVTSDGVVSLDCDIESVLKQATDNKIEAFIIKPVQPEKKKSNGR